MNGEPTQGGDRRPITWRGASVMPLLVILSLSILNFTVALLAVQPVLEARRASQNYEMQEAARLELGLARALVKTARNQEVLRESVAAAIAGAADPDACMAISTKEGTLVAGFARCQNFAGTTDDVWQPATIQNDQQTWVLSSQEGPFRIVVSRNVKDRDFKSNIIYFMFAVGVFIATLGQFLLWMALNRIHLSRIQDIADSARRMSAGDLNHRVTIKDRYDSYLVLASALNDIAERFQTQAEAMRIANNAAAHDLRMPLSRVSNSLQRVLNHRDITPRIAIMVEQAHEEVERAMSQFSALNTLARLETGAPLDTMEVADLATIVTTACELFDPVLEDAGILLDVKSVSIMAKVQVQLLTQALANLLQNAAKYAGAGALVVVICKRVDGHAEISVADNGPGIPEEDLERVTERYVRLDTSRSSDGFGLGLSMVVAVAKLHGGSFTLENASGLRGTIRLPVAPEGSLDV
jgi:signal transduction histidine kinase